MEMKSKNIIEYTNRNWTKISELDREYWETEYGNSGFEVTQRASHMLWQHMKSVRPDWPNSQERQCDMEHHIKLNKLLDQASDGLSLR